MFSYELVRMIDDVILVIFDLRLLNFLVRGDQFLWHGNILEQVVLSPILPPVTYHRSHKSKALITSMPRRKR